MATIRAPTKGTATAPFRFLVLVLTALLSTLASSLTIGGGAVNCGTGHKRTCAHPAPRAPIRHRTRSSAALWRTIGVNTGDVGRIDGPMSLSNRWESLASAQSHIDTELEGRLRGLTEERAPPLRPFEQHENSLGNSGSSDGSFIFVAGGLAIVLALGASFLLGAGADSALAGVIAWETTPSLAVRKLLSVGRRTSFVIGQISVGIAAFRERIVREPTANDIRERVAPVALETLQKMLLMEFWRRVWMAVFSKTKKGMHYIGGKATNLYTKYCPSWIQRGFQQIFKKAVEKRVQASAALLLGSVSSRAGSMLKQYWYQSEAPSFVPAGGMAT